MADHGRIEVFRRRGVRWLAAVAAVLVLVLLEFFLVRWWLAPDLESQGRLRREVAAGETVELGGAVESGDPIDFHLGHLGSERDALLVSIEAESARLDAVSRRDLELPEELASASSYGLFRDFPRLFTDPPTTESDPSAAVCPHTLVLLPDAAAPPLALSLESAKGLAPEERILILRPNGGALVLEVTAGPPRDGGFEGPGCERALRIDDWQGERYALGGYRLEIPAGADLRLTFRPARPTDQTFEAEFFEPFRASDPIHAREIVFARGATATEAGEPRPLLVVSSRADRPAITLERLELGPESLRVELVGSGRMRGPEAPEPKAFETLRRAHPLLVPMIATVLGSAQLAFLAWLKRLLLDKRGSGRRRGRRPRPASIPKVVRRKRRDDRPRIG